MQTFIKSPILLLLLIFIITASACRNPIKLLEQGEFDEAIQLSAKKIAGKKHKKTKYVKAIEEGFARATSSDMRDIQLLKKEAREENWVKINAIVQRIKDRQELIEPFLPIYSEDGYKAEFKFVRTDDLELESKSKAADYHYGEGKKLLAQAVKGDKLAARQAWEQFKKIKKYYPSYKDEKELMHQAKELGTVYLLFKIKNDSRVILPSSVENEISLFNPEDIGAGEWKQVHLSPENGMNYDYTITLRLTDVEFTPDMVKEREFVEDKQIEDGWEYVLDKNGNVAKDSSGNDIKVPKKIIIKANVLETYQHKAAHIGAWLEFYDHQRKTVFHKEPLSADAIFENYASTFKGDKRALTDETKKRIGNRPLPFPTNETLLMQGIESLGPAIREKILKNKDLL